MVERHHRAVRMAIIAAGAPFDVEHDLVGEQELRSEGATAGVSASFSTGWASREKYF